MKVVLMGYMGSGKSTIGKNLSEVLGYKFIDLDEYIFKSESLSINEIFKSKGEIYFRKKETSYLMDILGFNDKLIVALGGGTPCYGNNLEIIRSNNDIKSIYLKSSIKELVQRLKYEKQKRPLLSHIKTDDKLHDYIGKHLFERAPLYEKADEIILTKEKTIKEIVEEIVLRLI